MILALKILSCSWWTFFRKERGLSISLLQPHWAPITEGQDGEDGHPREISARAIFGWEAKGQFKKKFNCCLR